MGKKIRLDTPTAIIARMFLYTDAVCFGHGQNKNVIQLWDIF